MNDSYLCSDRFSVHGMNVCLCLHDTQSDTLLLSVP